MVFGSDVDSEDAGEGAGQPPSRLGDGVDEGLEWGRTRGGHGWRLVFGLETYSARCGWG